MASSFRVAARALRQIGAELITSDDVALNELIKNAFDARSPRVEVLLEAPADAGALSLLRERLLANPVKIGKKEAREAFQTALAPELSSRDRAAMLEAYDNALLRGSAGVAKFVGEILATKFKIVVCDTGSGMSAEDLESRFLVIGTPGKLLAKRASQVGDPTILGEKGIGRLSMMRLGRVALVKSKMASESRWHQVRFEWSEFDEPTRFLDEIEVTVEPAGLGETDVSGTIIEITELNAFWTPDKIAGFIQKYLRRLQDPFATQRKRYPVDVLLNGKRQPIPTLPDWLSECAQFRARITFDPAGVDAEGSVMRRSLLWRGNAAPDDRAWKSAELAERLSVPESLFESLGAFEATCLWFNRQSLNAQAVDRSRTDIVNELNVWCGGFAIYRDGFRVGQTGGMDDDWLEWDSRALKTKGYALNRYQTVGSVAISSQRNPRLIDASNRERLVSCPEQELLKTLLGVEIVVDLRGLISATQEAEVKIALAEESTEESLRQSENNLARTLKAFNQIAKAIPAEHKEKVVQVREAISDQIEYVKTIKRALDMAQETRVELLELANIGLVVEIVVHELARLTERTGELLAQLEDGKSRVNVVEVIDNLRRQIVATNKRVRTVDAMSPSGRNRKETYDVVAQTKTIVDSFKARMVRHGVEAVVTVDGTDSKREFGVYMVRGLVAQTLENLIVNSLHWVGQALKEGERTPTIQVDIDTGASAIIVTDNGPGVDPRYAKAIFKPYYSTRKKGKGLGLYIASELASYHGGKLYLDEMPDEDGRLRTFILELPREGK
ncbi:ATP-binding protein [Aromatoleum petrolei]|uniref:histidine kinase n=1 Tax=Aromatoleum petrolei TaxID=76116 RepID=A0ABX1MRA6_9RHOO|nr:ATP-binding protein [Aromatoleum petrolei]NMF89221.1 histidine kinase [Aromatoleum petrolei]QTQ34971.1 Putative two-component sensor kinase [Aromatoleum petrolei]